MNMSWNDPLLEACESAPCACNHTALDHGWSGCDQCICHKSSIHVLLASGVVTVELNAEPTRDGTR